MSDGIFTEETKGHANGGCRWMYDRAYVLEALCGKRKETVTREGDFHMNREEEVKMTHSGIFSKEGKRCVSVRFERGKDVAEAILPACKVVKNQGFTEEEVSGLENYLEMQNDAIFVKARELNHIKNLL